MYERRIGSLPGLVNEARTMDSDGGLRLVGVYSGRRCYAFVTRFGSSFTVMVYERGRGRTGRPGKRLTSQEFAGVGALRAFLRRMAPRKVEAYAY